MAKLKRNIFWYREGGRKRRKRKNAKLFVFFIFCALTAAAAYTVAGLDARLLPPMLAMTEKIAKNRINTSIDHSIQKLAKENALDTADFIDETTDSQGMVNSISVNTVLINDICGKLAVDVSRELEDMGSETIKIPLAAIFNIRAFANTGPSIPITVLPMGSATVDYETAFESVGINQINFRLWLRVDSEVRVVNPVQNQDIIVSRKIAMVNTVFSGKVPDTYLNNMPVAPYAPVGKDAGGEKQR